MPTVIKYKREKLPILQILVLNTRDPGSNLHAELRCGPVRYTQCFANGLFSINGFPSRFHFAARTTKPKKTSSPKMLRAKGQKATPIVVHFQLKFDQFQAVFIRQNPLIYWFLWSVSCKPRSKPIFKRIWTRKTSSVFRVLSQTRPGGDAGQ